MKNKNKNDLRDIAPLIDVALPEVVEWTTTDNLNNLIITGADGCITTSADGCIATGWNNSTTITIPYDYNISTWVIDEVKEPKMEIIVEKIFEPKYAEKYYDKKPIVWSGTSFYNTYFNSDATYFNSDAINYTTTIAPWTTLEYLDMYTTFGVSSRGYGDTTILSNGTSLVTNYTTTGFDLIPNST